MGFKGLKQNGDSHITEDRQNFRQFRIGDWLVETDLGRLSRDTQTMRVEPKVMDVLVYLAQRQGEVVTRDELERDVWHGALVGYDAVTSTVIKLRKALGDDAKHPLYIVTVPKRGYRLLPQVVPDPAPATVASTADRTIQTQTSDRRTSWSTVAAFGIPLTLVLVLAVSMFDLNSPVDYPEPFVPRTGDIPTLAVLPFANLGEKTEQQYFIYGVTENVIANLSKLSGLRVIARNSTYAFAGADLDLREAAKQLGVGYVLHGSVRSSGEKLRVITKLVDTGSGVLLWSEQFEGGVRDLFRLQDQVAEKTAASLSVKLTEIEKQHLDAQPTNNFAAYDYYLRGRIIHGSLSEKENELARSMYRRAIEKDPGFALAYAGLALSHIDDFRSGWGQESEVAAAEALKMAERAVSLDNRLPQAHFAVGFVYLYGRAEHERAILEAQRALTLDPNYADAYALLSSAYFFAGELEKTLELDIEAMRLNPASSFIYYIHLGRTHYLKGNYQHALDAFLIAAAKNYNYVSTQIWLAATYANLEDMEEADWAVDQVHTLDPEFSVDKWMERRPYKKLEYRERLISGLKAAGL